MANTVIENAAGLVVAEEKRVIKQLRDVVAEFTADLDSIEVGNGLPNTYPSEARNLGSNLRGMLSMHVQMVNDAYNRAYPEAATAATAASQATTSVSAA
jgi:hypothetical protein